MRRADPTRYRIEREDGTPVTATTYASMTEASLALLFEYADQLHYRIRPVATPPDSEDTTR